MSHSPAPSASQTLTLTPRAYLGFGHVWHKRLRPKVHQFVYPTFFLMLPMRQLAQQPLSSKLLAVNRPGALAFYDSDHGDGDHPQTGGALAWLEQHLQAHGVHGAQGEIWLQCYPRVWGYSFKPVSFWYCLRADHSLVAIVAEVNNTFGERHCYVLPSPSMGQTLLADKAFHVSPLFGGERRLSFPF